jgi:hypothetical protein
MYVDWFVAITSALIDGPGAWQTPRQIAASIGADVEETLDALADLDAAGLVSVWAEHAPLVVTLSPLAAQRLGVTLVETRQAEIFHWSRDAVSARSRRRPSARQLRQLEAHERALNEIEDPSQSIDLVVESIDREELIRRRRQLKPRIREMPRPSILLTGHPLIPWDEWPHRIRHRVNCRPKVCPVCRDRPLSRSTLCLSCGNWGWDRRKRPEVASETQNHEVARQNTRAQRDRQAEALSKSLDLLRA